MSESMRPAALSEADWALRARVWAHFAEHRSAPTVDELAQSCGLDAAGVVTALRRLEENHQLGLFPDRTDVWIANPFSATPTAYPVDTARGRYWANCAWDALGIPAILGVDGWTETRCAGSGQPLRFGVREGRLAGDDGVVHMVVPLARAWDDIGFT